MASTVFQPYRQYVATTRTSTSATKKAKTTRLKRGGRVRTVNAPKRLW